MDPIETHDQPPTYFKTNSFTKIHQSIVDSYGVARYKEINPAVFSCMTFPFLFGIMYGDIGHGMIITLVAAIFIWKEKQLLASNINEIIAMVFGGVPLDLRRLLARLPPACGCVGHQGPSTCPRRPSLRTAEAAVTLVDGLLIVFLFSRRSLHPHPDGSLCDLHWVLVQRFLRNDDLAFR